MRFPLKYAHQTTINVLKKMLHAHLMKLKSNLTDIINYFVNSIIGYIFKFLWKMWNMVKNELFSRLYPIVNVLDGAG